jgi:hypothetical protein
MERRRRVRELVKVSRRLPIDAAALRVAMLFLALDTLSEARRWTLGPLGAVDIDPEFTPTSNDGRDGTRRSSTRARLCGPDGYTVDAEIVLTTREGTEPRLSLSADPRCESQREPLAIAARAAIDELAEELLFFGSRQQTVS